MFFNRLLPFVLLLAVHTAAAQSGSDQFSVLSWNIQHFGASKDSAELALIARIVRPYDVVAIQEVVTAPAGAQTLARLADLLSRSGARWDYAISAPTNSPPYKTERYAFLWQAHKFQPCGQAVLLSALDTLIEREPFLLCLQGRAHKILLCNFHARTRNNYPEVEIAHLIRAVTALPEAPLVVLGDFNLSATHPVFVPLMRAGFTLATADTPTTLRRSLPDQPGASPYLHPYDHIFLPAAHFSRLDAGRVDFVGRAGSLPAALSISDHAPVWVRLQFR